MIEHVTLSNGFVTLAPFSSYFLDQVFEAAVESRTEISPWMGWMHPDYSIEEQRKWLERCPESWARGTDFEFAILDSGDSTFLGGCGLSHINPAANFANLGYWVRTSRTKQGVATAATRLVARFGFDQVGLDRAEIVVAVGNIASQRVAVKSGAIREGILRNRIKVRHKLHDAVMFSLIPEDFKTKNK